MPSPKVPIEVMSLDAFKQVMGINVTAVFQCCQEAIQMMKEQVPQGGRCVTCLLSVLWRIPLTLL